jgi:integrase
VSSVTTARRTAHAGASRSALASSTCSTSSRLAWTHLSCPALRGGHLNLHNWRAREWKPAIKAAGIDPPRRIDDLRHTYATMSLTAGVSLFSLARRMGTSVEMIDRTYGHLASDAEYDERGLLDVYDAKTDAFGQLSGTGAGD